MRVSYDPEADVLLIVLRDLPPVDAVEEAGGVIISYGEDHGPVSVEFLHASAQGLVRAGQLDVVVHTPIPSSRT